MIHLTRSTGVLVAASFLCAARGFAQLPQAVIAGVVRDQMGNPLAGAEVRVEGTVLRSVTDFTGVFSLRDAPSDSMRISVRRLGFTPYTFVAKAKDANLSRLDVRLDQPVQQLSVVTVSGRREVYDARLNGFYDRSKKQSGSFISREELDHLSSGRLSEALRVVPGVKFGQTQSRGQGPRSVRLRGANCPPLVFVDGFPASAGEFDIDMVDPWTVEGIEVYHGTATVPAEFLAAQGGERCGVVAIWSRPYRPPPRRRQSGKKADVADLVAARSVFTKDQVDLAAWVKDGTVSAAYPDSLFQNGVGGRVLTEFVVDTSGYVELETVGIVSSTHSLFSVSSVAALRDAVFEPALRNGRPVRQVVQLPFVFEPKLRVQAQKP